MERLVFCVLSKLVDIQYLTNSMSKGKRNKDYIDQLPKFNKQDYVFYIWTKLEAVKKNLKDDCICITYLIP